MGGMLGGGGGVGGSATGPYAAGGARLGITAAVGLGGGAAGGIGGVVNRESLRDVVTRAGGGGGNEDFVSIYGHHHRVGGVRREEDVSSAPRAGVSFVAYGTCNEAVRLGRGGDDHEHTTSIPAIPVLTAPAPHRDDNQGEIQVWQSRDLRDEESNKEKAAMASQMRVLEITGQQQTERRGGEGEGNELQLSKIDHHHRKGSIVANTNTNTSSSTCQDCGNQAKKDCSHMRCRTCCKSRGFDCSTHVKSTWVPAARRRERQQAEAAAIAAGHPRPKTKRARFISASNATTSHTSTSTSTPPRSSDINSTQITPQDLNFKESLPAEVRAQAVFKCVRVTAIEDGEDEYAYQATVKIRGHIFKGVLYDQRLDAGNMPSNLPDLHLGGRSAAASTSAMIDPSGVYGASGSAILGDPGATSNEVLQVLSTSPKKQCNSYKPLQEHQQFYGSNVRFMDFEISRNESYKMF